MTRSEHAARLGPILVSAALNRQTYTYGMVSQHLGVPANGLAQILGHIMVYCRVKGLPPLTVLVVNAETGKPGLGLETSTDFDLDRERVYRYRWIEHPAPHAAELAGFAPTDA
jgi:hypothetical protein